MSILALDNRQDLQRRVINIVGEQGFIVIFALWALYLTLNTDNFATTNNAFTVLRQAAVIGIVAIGAHFIILLGDIDLSSAATLTLCGVIMAKLMVQEDYAPLLAGIVTIGVGVLIGLINGLIITGMKINSIITTLGTSSVLGGLALRQTSGKTIAGDQIDAIEFLSRERLLNNNIPLPVIIMFVLYLAAFIILRRTRFGAHVFAVGNNARAAWLSGINTNLVKVMAYMLAGGLSAFGGIMQVARQGTATGTMGGDFLFPILTAVVLGGASLSGGRGKVFNTLIAAIFLTTITNGMVLLGYDINTQRIVSGGILIVALSLDRVRTLLL
ncbi:MAG: ABC transporter permease [Anaerolineae bacterium]|nr:MAG: ABC transporter permease [Anaerolineae bacterium]MCL4878630.1 ABC transporter permease [Anaerolineae bacterium]